MSKQRINCAVNPNPTNKWWWIWGKQIVHLKHYCIRHPEATELVKTKPIRGLQGKWESVSDSMEQLYSKVDLLRAMSVAMEHKNIGMKETWRTDWKLLKQMLHSGKIWFEFLVIYDWHELFVQPAFYMLKSKSIIKPKSGADFRREHIPKLALEALVLAQDMPQPGASDAVILAKAATYLPKALKHAQQRPSEGAGRKGFEIYSQDMTAWLRAWATSFCPQAMKVVSDHWMGFLTAPFLFGLATDPEIGAYFTRALLAAVAPTIAPPPAAALLATSCRSSGGLGYGGGTLAPFQTLVLPLTLTLSPSSGGLGYGGGTLAPFLTLILTLTLTLTLTPTLP